MSRLDNEREALRELREAYEPEVVGISPQYLRRLIIEEPYIRARLENPGGSVVLIPSSNPDQVSYGTHIGNDMHLDLIRAEQILEDEFSKGEQDTLREWAAGFTSQQAAEYNSVKGGTIRKRRERVIEKLETRLNGESRGSSNGDTAHSGTDEGQQSPQAGDSGREASEVSTPTRDTPEPNSGKAEAA